VNPLLPSDFWTRLALLDRCCAVTVYSTMIPQTQGRIWTANARRRDDTSRFVEFSGDTMLAAMLGMLLAAEAEHLTE
jgi:hypothetical protein